MGKPPEKSGAPDTAHQAPGIPGGLVHCDGGNRRDAGCKQCRDTGYYGRTGIFELLQMDDRLRELVVRCAPTAELREAAAEAGMTTMLQDGLEKAQQGMTTVEEVLRVLAVGQG